jgi:hypothetical protein
MAAGIMAPAAPEPVDDTSAEFAAAVVEEVAAVGPLVLAVGVADAVDDAAGAAAVGFHSLASFLLARFRGCSAGCA